MKKIFTILLLVATVFANAQSAEKTKQNKIIPASNDVEKYDDVVLAAMEYIASHTEAENKMYIKANSKLAFVKQNAEETHYSVKEYKATNNSETMLLVASSQELVLLSKNSTKIVVLKDGNAHALIKRLKNRLANNDTEIVLGLDGNGYAVGKFVYQIDASETMLMVIY